METEFRYASAKDGTEVVAVVRLDDRSPRQRGTHQVTIFIQVVGGPVLFRAEVPDLKAAYGLLNASPPSGGYWAAFGRATGLMADTLNEALRQAIQSDWTYYSRG
jgi:hypothetical protein